jgi:3-oxoacyl-[acyl-carrier protein] reductase
VLERNLVPALNVSRAAVPLLRARGGGVILMIASIWGREAGGSPSYNVAKAAEMSLAKAMARDLAADGIRVLSVAPGSTLFPGGSWERRVQEDPEGMAAFVARELPWGRFGTVEEVADVVTFLVSERASWVVGTCVAVDGGQSRSF